MAVWCAKCYGQDKHELLWEPRAESSPRSWERSSAIREVSLEELTLELCLGGLYRNSSFLSLLKVKISSQLQRTIVDNSDTRAWGDERGSYGKNRWRDYKTPLGPSFSWRL